MEIYLSIVSGFEAWNYALIYLCHSDFSLLFQTLKIIPVIVISSIFKFIILGYQGSKQWGNITVMEIWA